MCVFYVLNILPLLTLLCLFTQLIVIPSDLRSLQHPRHFVPPSRNRPASSSNRARRASARSLNVAPDSPSPPPSAAGEATGSSSLAAGDPGLESFVAAPDSVTPTLSRKSSEMNLEESESVSTNGRTRSSRSKGKGKEMAAAPVVRVKEEPIVVSLPPLELNLRQVRRFALLINHWRPCAKAESPTMLPTAQ